MRKNTSAERRVNEIWKNASEEEEDKKCEVKTPQSFFYLTIFLSGKDIIIFMFYLSSTTYVLLLFIYISLVDFYQRSHNCIEFEATLQTYVKSSNVCSILSVCAQCKWR